eukprot:TRINITY_DN2580_c0_g1_i9.p1 TRINITY_DN2580_c0_g1~~TRINITY_DN2580_c0_g1_i9.p1  ORF type:complete len:318 (+),score=49.60 TRINITY_DN2580_c0_g1_i9:155-1108(+)
MDGSHISVCANSDFNSTLTEEQQKARNRARSVPSCPKEDLHKDKIIEILNDLMDSGMVPDAINTIEGNRTIDGIEFTKRALIYGVEHSSYERELISSLLSAAYNIFQGGEIVDGFQLLLYRLPDLVLDVPNAPQVLAKFISRAYYDEIVPPAFFHDAHIDNQWAKEALSLAFAMLHSSDEKRRLEHVWGPGDLTSVPELETAVDQILQEYFENPNPVEAAGSVTELHAPSFGNQIVKQALKLVLDKNTEKSRTDLIILLTVWHQLHVLSSAHIKRGFQHISNQLDDLKLDIPNVHTTFSLLVNLAINKQILPKDYVK